MRRLISTAFAAIVLSAPVLSQDRSFVLSAPSELEQSGLLKHILPRFSLKTGVRITLGDEGAVRFGSSGTPVFKGPEQVWHIRVVQPSPHTQRFSEWLTSDIGKRTIDSFSDGMFSSDVAPEEVAVVAEVTGDAALGEKISLVKCGRCHVVSAKNRMDGIGSSPSFKLLRGFPDWQYRFESFFVLKPHPAFTQVEDVTAPFDPTRPSPIRPIVVTLEEIEAITAYVARLEPADLGAPLTLQFQ